MIDLGALRAIEYNDDDGWLEPTIIELCEEIARLKAALREAAEVLHREADWHGRHNLWPGAKFDLEAARDAARKAAE